MKKYLAGLIAVLTLAACGQEKVSDPADTVFWNGAIYTANDSNPMVEAVAVDDGYIVYAGSRAGAESFVGDSTDIIDLNGAGMYPGFTDAHGHLNGVGRRELELNLEGVASIEALKAIIAEEVEGVDEGALIFGRGWIETHWPEGRFPSRHDLDEVAPDNPVILTRADGHAIVANTAAINAAGVTPETVVPEGGDILKDESGQLTGIFVDAAMQLIYAIMQAPTVEDQAHYLDVGADVYAAYGWTGIHSVSFPLDALPALEAMSDNGEVGIRVYASPTPLFANPEDIFEALPSRSESGRIIARSIKLYMDGALGSRGAALLESYADADTSGLVTSDADVVKPLLQRALREGIQVNMHAIGDRGNRMVLDWFEEAFETVPESEWAITDVRWRNEHAQIIHPDDIPRFAELGVIPSMQPSHAIGDLYFAPDRLGEERLETAYPWRSLIDSGSIIAGGTDAPVERGDPRIEFFAASERTALNGFSGPGWHREQRVMRDEALKMFTLWPAIASFQEAEIGSIEVGKKADFTVFSGDIMTIPAADILNVETVLTIVDGQIVYDGR